MWFLPEMSSVCDSDWSRDYHDDIGSRVTLSGPGWFHTVSCSPSHTTNCNNAHAPGRFHLQPYKVQACQEKNNQNLPMSRCRYHGRCRSSRSVDGWKIQRSPHSCVIWVKITDYHTLVVFSSRKVRKKVVIARFDFIWQLLSNHRVISLKKFVSSFRTKLCN